MFQRFLLLCFFAAQSFVSVSQEFQKLSAAIGINHSYLGSNGAGGSFYDWDKDGYPDISLTINGGNPVFYHNNSNGTFELLSSPFFEDSGNIKSLNWIDFDNDGDADISVNRYEGPFDLYENDGNFNFTNISASAGFPVTDHYGYGHSWGDYDRDGYIDLYICNYHYYEGIVNYLFRNNGDGTFTEVGESAGVSDGYNYSFQSVWCDFNEDGWQDLHVINDKVSANHLYLNNGDGTFTDISAESGTNVIIEAMTNTVADYDNDGDWDIYLTNAIESNVLLRANSALSFSNYTMEAGVGVEEMCWGSIFIDYDNNGWSDLLVGTAGVSNELYTNQMDGSFTRSFPVFLAGTTITHCLMEADFDRDGRSDYVMIDRPPSLSTVWRNSLTTLNNFIDIGLQGVISNRDAIGSRIEVYCNGNAQRKHLCSSENYLTQNSQYLHFGLGTGTTIDSLFVAWPSGWTEKFYDLPVNEFISIIEGQSLQISFSQSDGSYFCDGDEFVLSANGWSNYLWNTGDESSSIVIQESGYYQVESMHESGLIITSDSIFIEKRNLPAVVAEIQEVSCHGISDGAISLSPEEEGLLIELEWNNGLSDLQLTNLLYGTYSADIIDEYGCESQWSYELIDPPALNFTVEITNPTCYGMTNGMLALSYISGDGPFDMEWSNEMQSEVITELEAGDYSVNVINQNGCTWNWEGIVEDAEPIDVDLQVIQLSCFESNDGSIEIQPTGGSGTFTYFINSLQSDSISQDLSSGQYEIQVIDENQCVWESSIEIVEPNELVVEYDVIPESDLELGSIELNISGGTEPYFITIDNIETESSITNLESGIYEIHVNDANDCFWTSDLEIEFYISVSENDSKLLLLYPNPTNDFIRIKTPMSTDSPIDYLLIDSQGKQVNSGQINNPADFSLELAGFKPGIYQLLIPSESLRASFIYIR